LYKKIIKSLRKELGYNDKILNIWAIDNLFFDSKNEGIENHSDSKL